jgi:hypothetical protein
MRTLCIAKGFAIVFVAVAHKQTPKGLMGHLDFGCFL